MKSVTRLPQAVTENLVIRELEDETLVYDTKRDEAHCLNHSAALVWKHCDGKTTATQAARHLQRELGASVDADFVWLAVKQLGKSHLVEVEHRSPSFSRRELVLKYAPAALALPLIMSINAPTPAQSASCGGQSAPCGAPGNLPCCPGCSCDGICFCNP